MMNQKHPSDTSTRHQKGYQDKLLWQLQPKLSEFLLKADSEEKHRHQTLIQIVLIKTARLQVHQRHKFEKFSAITKAVASLQLKISEEVMAVH